MTEKAQRLLLAAQRDYDPIFRILRCSRSEFGLQCREHGAEWYFNRCMTANAIALRLGASVRQMAERTEELERRLSTREREHAEPEGSYERGVDDGLAEAIRIVGTAGRGRADFRLRKHLTKVRQLRSEKP